MKQLYLSTLSAVAQKRLHISFRWLNSTVFRSRAYKRKGSLEVIFFRNVRPYVFLENYGTPHMTIYGAQVNRKWTGSGSEVQCEGTTSTGRLRPAIFFYNLSRYIILNAPECISRSKKCLKFWGYRLTLNYGWKSDFVISRLQEQNAIIYQLG